MPRTKCVWDLVLVHRIPSFNFHIHFWRLLKDCCRCFNEITLDPISKTQTSLWFHVYSGDVFIVFFIDATLCTVLDKIYLLVWDEYIIFNHYTPVNEVVVVGGGGGYWFHYGCLSVEKWFLLDNTFSDWHTIMIHHICIDRKPMRTSIDFGVKRSRSYLDFKLFPFPHDNSISFWLTIMMLHTCFDIDFGVQR